MKRIVIIAIFATMTHIPAKSQMGEDMHIFGSLQTMFLDFNLDNRVNVMETGQDSSMNIGFNSFLVQQMDIFFNSEINDNFYVFADIEFKTNFSSDKNWGALNLQEAWLNYSESDALNVKAGWLFPRFNKLNEIKNKLALQKYLIRPIIYESIFSSVLEQEDFAPGHAFLQVYGILPVVADLRFDYAVYVGNSEDSFISSYNPDEPFCFMPGADSNGWDGKLIGGRVGLLKSDETFQAGVSVTYDKDDRTRPSVFYMPDLTVILPAFGKIPRIRVGMDLSFTVSNIEFEAELIDVIYDYDYPEATDYEFGQLFYYGMVGYHFFDELFLYGGFYREANYFSHMDATQYAFGLNYSLTEKIKLKSQFVHHEDERDFSYYNAQTDERINASNVENATIYALGVSVLF